MTAETWQKQNCADIDCKLRPLKSMPDGVLHDGRTRFHRPVVVKKGDQIQLYFADPFSGRPFSRSRKSGYMSRISIVSPLHLLGLYTQAMMLALAWKPRPESVCILGLGGGRLAMVLHHYFPEVVIDCIEIDPEIVDISETFFGVRRDERLRITVQEGGEYMQTLPEGRLFDIIIVDCFTGTGHHPHNLSTVEFYDICRAHLTEGGVLSTNLLPSDPLLEDKVKTLASSFAFSYRFLKTRVNVLFGCDAAGPTEPDIIAAAEKADSDYRFSFTLSDLARCLSALEPPAAGKSGG